MLNFYYLRIIKTSCQDKMIPTFRLYQNFKKIDLICMILKESKSWGKKKEERNLDILQKRYIHATKTKHVTKTNSSL